MPRAWRRTPAGQRRRVARRRPHGRLRGPARRRAELGRVIGSGPPQQPLPVRVPKGLAWPPRMAAGAIAQLYARQRRAPATWQAAGAVVKHEGARCGIHAASLEPLRHDLHVLHTHVGDGAHTDHYRRGPRCRAKELRPEGRRGCRVGSDPAIVQAGNRRVQLERLLTTHERRRYLPEALDGIQHHEEYLGLCRTRPLLRRCRV